MIDEYRKKILKSVSGKESLALFSPNGLSLNSTYGSVDLAFQSQVIGNLKKICIVGQHNIKTYRITFFDLNYGVIDEQLFNNDQDGSLYVDEVAAIHIEFLETIDNKTICNVKLSLQGCYYQISNYKSQKPATIKPTKSPHSSHAIDLLDRKYAKSLCSRVGGTLNLPNIYKAPEVYNGSSFFVLEFKNNVLIRNIQAVSILNKDHQVEKICVELLNKHRQIVRQLNLSMHETEQYTHVYAPSHPTRVKYLQVTILEGKASSDLIWSIIADFVQTKKLVLEVDTLEVLLRKGKLVFINRLKSFVCSLI